MKKSNVRLILAAVLFVFSLVGSSFLFAAQPAEANQCWRCVSIDICGESPFGSQDCTVECDGGICQCQPFGGICRGGW